MSINLNQVTDTITPGSGSLNVSSNVVLATVGNGLLIKEGTNAAMGVATLVNGYVTVSTTKVTANSRIFLSAQTFSGAGAPAHVSINARSAGTSFQLRSADSSDTSTIAWMIVEPSP